MTRILLISVFYLLGSADALAQESGSIDDYANAKDQLYITDQLRLSLYQQADAQSKVLKLLISGDKLAIEEIAGPYAFVTTLGGKKGWVKRGFLVSKPTSNILLAKEVTKNELLVKEIEKLKNSKQIIDQYERDMDLLSQCLEAVSNDKKQADIDIVSLKRSARNKQDELDLVQQAQRETPPPEAVLLAVANDYWKYLLPIVLVLMLIGFIIGKLLIESRIKRKFHGIKVW